MRIMAIDYGDAHTGAAVSDLTGLLGLLLLQRQRELRVTGLELRPEAALLAERAGAENSLGER